jgi:hypothetical protein
MIGSDKYRSQNVSQHSLRERDYRIYAEDFTTVEQAVPIRLCYGHVRVAGVQVAPIFNFHREPVKSDQRKKNSGAPSSYRYWGTLPVVICHGLPNDDSLIELMEISNGDTVIWTGSNNNTGADSNGKTRITTTIGHINIYWGSFDQEVDDEMASLTIDIDGGGRASVPASAWRGICWALLDDVSFGQQPVPPTLLFRFRRIPRLLPSTVGAALDQGELGAFIPEVIFDLLTNTRYGAGLQDVDITSFDAATVTCDAEGLILSPNIDSQQQLDSLISELLQAIDAVLYVHEGNVKIRLIRKMSSIAVRDHIDESDLLDEPQANPSIYEDTWNQTIVSFTDAENKWEKASVAFEDPANAAIVGQSVSKTFEMPAVTLHSVAVQIATRLGVRGGLPALFWDLKLKPAWRTILPGELYKLSYAKFGISERVVRVRSVKCGGPSNPDVQVTVQEEETRDTSNDYVTPAENFLIPGTINDDDGTGDFAPTSTTPHLSWLPPDLITPTTPNVVDGFLMCCNAPNKYVTSGKVYIGYSISDTRIIGTSSQFDKFPAAAELLCWHRINSTRWMLRFRPSTDSDYDFIQTMIESSADMFCVVGRRDVRTVGMSKSEHQVMSPWLQVIVGGYSDFPTTGVIDIEVVGEGFGTDDLRLEGSGADGYFPCADIFFGRFDRRRPADNDFFIYLATSYRFQRTGSNNRNDTALKRYVTVPVATHNEEQDIDEATSVYYDRDDTTMCADGTFSQEWGAAAPTTYEIVNVEIGRKVTGAETDDYDTIEDIDVILGKLVTGAATTDQALVVAHIDTVLGSMISDGHLYYAE